MVSLLLGPRFINKMQDIRVGQVIRQEGPSSHLSKKGTPTMGGTLILSSIFISSVLWGDLTNKYLWVALGVTTLFGILGWVDDLFKLRYESSKRLSALSKIFWQIPIISYSERKEGVIKKQMKFNSNTKEEVAYIVENCKK